MASWHNLGLNKETAINLPTIDLPTIRIYLDRFGLNISDLTLECWLDNNNDDGPGFSILSDEEIIEEVQNLNNAEEEAITESDEEIIPLGEYGLTSAQVVASCEPLIRWAELNISSDEESGSIKAHLFKLLSIAKNKRLNCNTQSNITDFFINLSYYSIFLFV